MPFRRAYQQVRGREKKRSDAILTDLSIEAIRTGPASGVDGIFVVRRLMINIFEKCSAPKSAITLGVFVQTLSTASCGTGGGTPQKNVK